MSPADDHQAPVGRPTIASSDAVAASPPVDAITDGRERKLDPRSIQAERISGGIFSAVVSGALLIGVVILGIAGSVGFAGGLLLLGGWMMASFLVAGLSLWWPSLSYRYTAYRVSERGMRIRRGVVWRTVSSVPRSRVQHTDVSQGPIERMFGLATLVIYTAGTHHASVLLSGLAHDTALRIRDHLIAGGEDDAV